MMHHPRLNRCGPAAAVAIALLAWTGRGAATEPTGTHIAPPAAKIVSHEFSEHGRTRTDNYYWMKNRDDPEVVAYLKAENDYTKRMLAHTEPLQQKLFEEFKGRIKQDDTTAPYPWKGHFYYSRTEDGKSYPIYCRKRGSLDAAEEILLDVNKLARRHAYYIVWGVDVSPNQRLLAYAWDNVGRNKFNVQFKDLETGETLSDSVPEVTGNVAWANDSRTIFYTRQHPQTLRFHQVYRHRLGTPVSEDVLVYEEPDETFNCFVETTKSERFIVIASHQTVSNEYRFLDADDPEGEFTLFAPRERGREYEIDHLGEHFYIRTNHEAENFRLMRTPMSATGYEHWEEVIPHRDDVYFDALEVFQDFLVLTERKGGLIQLRIRPADGSQEHYLDFGEPAYWAYIGVNRELDTPVLRYGYTSLTTPSSTYDYNMRTRERSLVKQQEILGGFSPENYRTERLHATARDGTQVPVSLVYRQEAFRRDGTSPILIDGYGAYGSSFDPLFDPNVISLLDRGFVYAIAHVRGGQELGRKWYDDGKLLKKKNSFTDFIDCTEHLVREKYADPKRVFAWGRSAGGLLVGAVLNMRPDLYHGVIAEVPFVDLMTTMLDGSIPLTTSEFDEWGNPQNPEYYAYMLSYSPYDNVAAREYPNLLVTTGLHDPHVQYWEPAKWVARLRATKTDDNRLLLHTNMESGHSGVSGRYERYKETALRYAFLIDLAGR